MFVGWKPVKIVGLHEQGQAADHGGRGTYQTNESKNERQDAGEQQEHRVDEDLEFRKIVLTAF